MRSFDSRIALPHGCPPWTLHRSIMAAHRGCSASAAWPTRRCRCSLRCRTRGVIILIRCWPMLRVAPHVLERLEDRHADLLLAAAQNAGCATLTAHMARAWLDLNRAPNEIDPQMIVDAPRTAYAQPSIKVRGGLGPGAAPSGRSWRTLAAALAACRYIGPDQQPARTVSPHACTGAVRAAGPVRGCASADRSALDAAIEAGRCRADAADCRG